MNKLRFASYLFAGKAAVVLPFMSAAKADEEIPAELQAAMAQDDTSDSAPRNAFTGTTSPEFVINEVTSGAMTNDGYGQGVITFTAPTTSATLDIQITGVPYGADVWLISSTVKDGWNMGGAFANLRVGDPNNFKIVYQQSVAKPYAVAEGVAAKGYVDVAFSVDVTKFGLANANDTMYIQAMIYSQTQNPLTGEAVETFRFSELDTLTVQAASTY